MTKAEQLPFNLGHRQAYERDDFFISDSNREAVAWIDKWPDWVSSTLIIIGPPASGKTHLLQVWKKESASFEIKANNLSKEPLEDILGDVKTVMIDDISGVIGDLESEKALFHLYNSIKSSGGSLLLTSPKPLKEYEFKLPDLKSRLLSALAIAISSPDEELMAILLTKLFSDRQIFVSQEVVNFIIPRVERSFIAIRDLVDKIDHKALSNKKSITIPLVKDILTQ